MTISAKEARQQKKHAGEVFINAGAKKDLDALENDKKANFQENIPSKVRFQ